MRKMSKKTKIIIGVSIVAIIIAFAILTVVLYSKKDVSGKIVFKDCKGNIMAEISSVDFDFNDIENNSHRQYLQFAVPDAIKSIKESKNISEDKAIKYLLKNNCTVETAFSESMYSACEKGCSENITAKDFATVIADKNGKVFCIYSSYYEGTTYALVNNKPYSSFKPLSVYAPAIENNVATWSKVYEDMPVKKVKRENGKMDLWPQNASQTYSDRPVTVCRGISKSLNTIAVRCLLDLGVENSVEFLKNNFDIDLSKEEKIMSELGEQEILGNLALGYIQAGVSPIQMVGYYQIFMNGGQYSKPYAVERILKDEKVVYSHEHNPKQVIGEDTAFIMNEILHTPLYKDGTAHNAYVNGVDVGGKSGTGMEFSGNWFVGFTPEYVCSVWHGQDERNNCSKTFSKIMENIPHDKNAKYPDCEQVINAKYCKESGKIARDSCGDTDFGWYKEIAVPKFCDGNHK